ARHIPLERLSEEAESLPQDRPLVFQCRVGARSAMAAQAFRAAGFDAYNLSGGLVAWAARGLPLSPEGGTVADH
ncbi:MAG: rhodanese-like domain-containing protein, partial [Thermoleophilaceae bacterium]